MKWLSELKYPNVFNNEVLYFLNLPVNGELTRTKMPAKPQL